MISATSRSSKPQIFGAAPAVEIKQKRQSPGQLQVHTPFFGVCSSEPMKQLSHVLKPWSATLPWPDLNEPHSTFVVLHARQQTDGP